MANPTYYKGRPNLDKVIYKAITPETATAQIQSGELDIFLAAGAANFDLLSTNATLDVRSVTSPGIFTFQFNSETQAQRDAWKTDLGLDLPPLEFNFSDKRVRQAMYYAIDRRTINDELFGGRNRILWNPPGFDENIEGLNKFEYDPDKAKALLQEAVAAGAVDLSKPIRFYYATDLNDGGRVAPIIKSQLEGLGVGLKVELTGVTTDQWLATISDDTQRGNYDVTFDAGGNEGLGPWNTVRYVLCGSDAAAGRIRRLRELRPCRQFNMALTQVDEAERAATYAEIAKVLNDDQPQLYLWSLSGVHVVNKRLQNVMIPAFERYAFEDVNTWSVTQ